MSRFLIFLFPAMMDIILGAIFFIASVRIDEAGGSPLEVTAITIIWAIAYMIFSPIMGRLTTDKNSVWLIILGCVLMSVSTLLFILLPSKLAAYLIMVVIALSSSLFFTPFQVFMKAVENGEHSALSRSTGLYTFSWSSGMAAGPFITTYLWKLYSWQISYTFCAVVAILTAIGILFLNKQINREKAEPAHDELKTASQTDVIDYSNMPDLIILSWVFTGIGSLTVALIRSYIPACNELFHISREEIGLILALVSGSQAITGLILCRSKFWMYKKRAIASFGLLGILALSLFSFSVSAFPIIIAAIFYGTYSGAFFFLLVFHASVHPEKSTKYIGINEGIVGFTAIVGPLLAGLLGEHLSPASPYMLAMGLIAFSILFLFLYHKKTQRNSTN